ncbi:MAG: cysteine hydrolase [Proteobacteria bacterium]|nr:cysteine hydrolase [Pseudomonadota bacterium]
MSRTRFAADGKGGLSRHVPLRTAAHTALLVIDVQQYCTIPGDGEFPDVDPDNIPEKHRYYFERIATKVLPNIARLQAACRGAGAEVIYTVIEAATPDMRDLSLDYKISGIGVPKGSPWAQLPPEIPATPDEIVIPKTSSSVFMSTNIDYVLRNLEIEQLICCGLLTDQCVESAVRDACDLGYLVTVPEDACGTHTQERHERSLDFYKGYCRIVPTEKAVAELQGLSRQAAE